MITRIIRDLEDYARKTKAIFLKLTRMSCLAPASLTPTKMSLTLWHRFSEGTAKAWLAVFSGSDPVRNTVLIDLRQDEETLLASMKQKTRYNIRLAARKGVTIRQEHRRAAHAL